MRPSIATFGFLSVITACVPPETVTSSDITHIAAELDAGRLSAEAVLTSEAHRALLDDPESRLALNRTLREHPATGGLRMTGKNEPGTPLHLEATFVDGDGSPIADLRIYLFQAGVDGKYAAEASGPGEGDGNPRLFAWLVTDPDGRIVLDTILPGPYGEAPPHFHMMLLRAGDETARRIGRRLYFDAGDAPVHPEIRSDAAEGVAWIVPIDAREAGIRVSAELALRGR